MTPERRDRERWRAWYQAHAGAAAEYDGWLQPFEKLIARCAPPAVDLGCGLGNDTRYLLEQGRNVIPCDVCEEAVEAVRRQFPAVRRTECFDMRDGLPFADGFTDLVVADLSLHYFSERDTAEILAELRRVLTGEGTLLFRVNSVKDVHYGAGEGREVEPHFHRMPDGQEKRFFDERDLRSFFRGWEELFLREETMTRYGAPKILWTGAFRVRKA